MIPVDDGATARWGSMGAMLSVLRALLLTVVAVVFNVALGHWVQYVMQWPLFLDSIGAILVGALLGPLWGAATGALTNLLWAQFLGDPSIAPYALVAAFIGWAAGYAVQLGAFRRAAWVMLAGLLTGVGAALFSAPITAYVFGGITQGGADYLTAHLTATGANLLQAATLQGFISDPVDKLLSFTVAWLLWRRLRVHFTSWAQDTKGTQDGGEILQRWGGYSMAVIAGLISLLFSFVFLPAFGRSVFSIFYVAVLLSAWRGGLRPALFTTAVGAAANLLLLISPYYAAGITAGIAAEDWLRTLIFVLVSVAIAVIVDQLGRRTGELQDALLAERAGQARLRAIADGVDEALALISPEQRVLAVNRRFGELFAVPTENIVGQHLEDTRTLYEQIFEDADALYEASMVTSRDAEESYTRLIVQKWPHYRELLHYSAPVHDDDGFLGRLFVFRDVTHEREVDRLKDEFVSMVSHELRTPLTSIKGFTEMVLDGDAGEINEEVADYLGTVHSNAERLVALVNELLDLSRIESGRVEIKRDAVDLAEIVALVVRTMQPKLDEKQQHLSAHVEAGIVAQGDRDKLIQVLTNYVSNAHKYSQVGSAIDVTVTCEEGFARIAVADNGHGIAPEDQAKLFTRFYRVDNSMTREVGGTGLGLSIVKQLIELQGGEVGVRSALGQGSTFWFTVPID